jgi:hypothetical protein
MPEYNVIGPRTRHLDRIGELADTESHRGQQLVAQNFAGMNGWEPAPGRDIRKVHNAPVNVLTLDGHWNSLLSKADGTIVARLVNRYLNSVPKSAKGSIELLKSSCMVQSKQPINRFALPVQAPH